MELRLKNHYHYLAKILIIADKSEVSDLTWQAYHPVMEEWMRKTRLVVAIIFLLVFCPMNAPSLISASDSNMCDWLMAGRNPENIRVAPNECGPERTSLDRVWVNKYWGSLKQPPVVVDGKLYLATFSGRIVCLDTTTGYRLWESNHDDDDTISDDFPLLFDNGMIYVPCTVGIKCLDAKSGRLLWVYNTGSGSLNTNMIPYKNKICFMISSYVGIKNIKPQLQCINGGSGKIEWKIDLYSYSHAGLAISNGTIYVSNDASEILAIDTENGNIKWKNKLPCKSTANPSIYSDKIFVNTDDGTIICLNGLSGEIVWQNKKTFPNQDYSSPTVYNGKVYTSTRCVDIKTGLTIWENEMPKPVADASFCNLRMYFGGHDSTLHCLDSETGKTLWCYKDSEWFESVPVIANGMIMATSMGGNLYCFSDHKTNNSTRIELSVSSDTICTGKYAEVKAKVFDTDGNWIENAPVDWSIKPDFANIHTDGTVWSYKPCIATVTCRSNDLSQTLEIQFPDFEE